LVKTFTAGMSFTQLLDISPDMETGRNVVTAAAEAKGEMAPVTGVRDLEITKAIVSMEVERPFLAWIPGSIDLRGRMWSELGPLENSGISITTSSLSANTGKIPIANSALAALSRIKIAEEVKPYEPSPIDEGYFETHFDLGMNWSLLGILTLNIRVEPQEPWNAPLTLKTNIFVINFINLGILLVILAALGTFLPRQLRKWYAARPQKIMQPRLSVKETALPASVSIRRGQGAGETWIETPEEPGNTLLHWFYKVVELVQKITGVILKPDQTLREFDRQSSPKLGPLAGYFHDLVMVIEKALYSRHKSGKEDEEQAIKLAERLSKASEDSLAYRK
jgi:hypothetical protein